MTYLVTKAGVLRVGTRTLPTAIWLAAMAALAIEAAGMIVRTALGDFTSFLPYTADFARLVTRAAILASAISAGILFTSATSARAVICGALGAAFGPVACIVGRILAESARARMHLPSVHVDPTLFVVLAIVRSLEFGSLGFLAGQISRKRAPASSFAWAGVAVALAFGIAVIAVRYEVAAGTAASPEILAQAVEEVAFPVAIALIVAAATRHHRT